MRKYNNKITVVDNIRFQSKKEAERYVILKAMARSNLIGDLRLQVPFILSPSVVIGGRKRPALRYFADFVYTKDGKQIIEDVKGKITEGYRIKRHLMAVMGLAILET